MSNDMQDLELRTKASIAAGALDELVEDTNVNCWLLSVALREVRQLEGENMTEASALLQALDDRLQDFRTLYLAQDNARQVLAGLEVKAT